MAASCYGSCAPLAATACLGHRATMEPPTPLELAALTAIASEMSSDQAVVFSSRVINASVSSRKNTGGGFFTKLVMDTSGFVDGDRHLGDRVWINVDGLNHGLGMILHITDENSAVLEGYAVGPEDTSAIVFTDVPFAVATMPGALVAASQS